MLLVEAILFGLFVVAIGCDQLQAVFTDETAIEQVQKKGPFRPRKPRMALLSEVFGRGKSVVDGNTGIGTIKLKNRYQAKLK